MRTYTIYSFISSTVCEAIWLRNLLESLNDPQEEYTVINVDDESISSQRIQYNVEEVSTLTQCSIFILFYGQYL